MTKELYQLDGFKVKSLRKAMNLTMEGLGKALRDFKQSLSVDTLADIERGHRLADHRPTCVHENTWRAIARALDVEPDTILVSQSSSDDRQSVPPEWLRHYLCSFDAFIEDRTQGFVGRTFVFQALDEFLGKSSRHSGYFLIYGLPGIGKTAFIAELVKTRKYVSHFNIGLQAINTPRHFVGNLCAQLIDRFQLPYSRFPEDAFENGAFLNGVLQQASEKLKEHEQLVLAVDAIDEVSHPDLDPGANILFLPPSLPPGIFFVLTTRRQHDGRLQVARQKSLDLEADGQGNLRDVREYLASRLREKWLQTWVTRSGVNQQDFTEELVARSEGNFMYLHYVFMSIANGDFSDVDLRRLPSGLMGYYQAHWRKMRSMNPTQFDALPGRVVCVLAAAKEAVSIQQIADWVQLDRTQVHQIIRQWREFLYEEPVPDGEPCYRLYHATFKQFLMSEEVDVDLRRTKEMIANAVVAKHRRLRTK